MSRLSSRAITRRQRSTDPLFRREMRERWRRPLTLLQLLILASALSWIGFNIYYTRVPQGEFIGIDSDGAPLVNVQNIAAGRIHRH